MGGSPKNEGLTPTDSIYAAAFLASEQAGYITGTVLNVSGGLYT
jgi:NAD(P)-dependent dehydrogenase (short-subunit alcohol dehydrogenase family)